MIESSLNIEHLRILKSNQSPHSVAQMLSDQHSSIGLEIKKVFVRWLISPENAYTNIAECPELIEQICLHLSLKELAQYSKLSTKIKGYIQGKFADIHLYKKLKDISFESLVTDVVLNSNLGWSDRFTFVVDNSEESYGMLGQFGLSGFTKERETYYRMQREAPVVVKTKENVPVYFVSSIKNSEIFPTIDFKGRIPIICSLVKNSHWFNCVLKSPEKTKSKLATVKNIVGGYLWSLPYTDDLTCYHNLVVSNHNAPIGDILNLPHRIRYFKYDVPSNRDLEVIELDPEMELERRQTKELLRLLRNIELRREEKQFIFKEVSTLLECERLLKRSQLSDNVKKAYEEDDGYLSEESDGEDCNIMEA